MGNAPGNGGNPINGTNGTQPLYAAGQPLYHQQSINNGTNGNDAAQSISRADELQWSDVDISKFLDDDFIHQYDKRNALSRQEKKAAAKQSEINLYDDELESGADNDGSDVAEPVVTEQPIDDDDGAGEDPALTAAKAIKEKAADDARKAREERASSSMGSATSISDGMIRHLVDDINGICDQYQSKSVLHTRLLFIQRVQLAMNRERSLYRRKLESLSTPISSWHTIKRKQEQAADEAHGAQLTQLPVHQQLVIRFALATLSHVDASKKDLVNLLPILAEIAPQISSARSSSSSSSNSNGDAILQHIERFLMDVFTGTRSLLSNTSSNTSDVNEHKLLVNQLVATLLSLSVSRAQLGNLLQLVQRTLFEASDASLSIKDITIDCEPLRRLSRVHKNTTSRTSSSPSSSSSSTSSASSLPSAGNGGSIYSFGRGKYGSLGHGDDSSRKSASLVSQLEGNVAQIAAGSSHVVAIDTTGRTWAWGTSGARLGHGSTSSVEKVPRLISRLASDTIIEVACGHTFTLLLSVAGHVYAMGDGGTEGVLPKTARSPTKLQGILHHRIRRIGAGAYHAFVQTHDNQLLAFGKNGKGQLGVGHANHVSAVAPEEVKGGLSGHTIKKICGGWTHTLAVTESGLLYSWGGGHSGKPVLGHATSADQLTPRLVEAFNGKEVINVSCGWDHSCALVADGTAYTWGDGTYGRLGHGNRFNESVPKKVDITHNGTPVVIANIIAGATHTGFISNKGMVYTCGSGALYELGNELPSCQYRAVPLLSLSSLSCTSLALGANFTIALIDPNATTSVTVTSTTIATSTTSDGKKEVKGNEKSSSSSSVTMVNKRVYNAGGLLELPQLQLSSKGDASLSGRYVSLSILGHIDRLCHEHTYKASARSGTSLGDTSLLNETVCIQVNRDNLARLQCMLRSATTLLTSDNTTDVSEATYTFISILRILRSNVHRLLLSGVDPQSLGITIPGVKRTIINDDTTTSTSSTSSSSDSKSVAADFDVDELKTLLYNIIDNSGIIGHCDTAAATIIMAEAIEFVRIAVDIFYPSAISKLQLAKYLLNNSDTRAISLRSVILEKLCDDNIAMTFIPIPSPYAIMRVTVQNVNGSISSSIDIAKNGSVRDLKKAISLLWPSYDIKRQRIIFAGQEWSDDTILLADAGIVSGAIIKSVLKGVSKIIAAAVANPKVPRTSQSNDSIYSEEKAVGSSSSVSYGSPSEYYTTQVAGMPYDDGTGDGNDDNGDANGDDDNIDEYDDNGAILPSAINPVTGLPTSIAQLAALKKAMLTGGAMPLPYSSIAPLGAATAAVATTVTPSTPTIVASSSTSAATPVSSSSSSVTTAASGVEEKKEELVGGEVIDIRAETAGERDARIAAQVIADNDYSNQSKLVDDAYTAIADELSSLLSLLVTRVSDHSLAALKSSSPASVTSTSSNDALPSIILLQRSLQKHITSWLARSVESCDTSPLELSTSLRVCRGYITSIIAASIPLCDAANGICSASRVITDSKLEAKASASDRDDWMRRAHVAHEHAITTISQLRSSIVGVSLPSLIMAAALLPSHIRVVHDIAPSIIHLLSSLAAIITSCPSPHLAAVSSTLLDEEEFKEDRRDEPIATAGSASTSSKAKPKKYIDPYTGMAASSASYVPPTSIPTHAQGGYHGYPPVAMLDENGQYVAYAPSKENKDDDDNDDITREEKKAERGLTSVNAWISEIQRQCAYLMATLIEADITSTSDSNVNVNGERRVHGLRSLRRLFTVYRSPLFQIQLLRSLRMAIAQRHILDSLDGCDAKHIEELTTEFVGMLRDTVSVINDDNAPFSLRVNALGVWVFRVRASQMVDRALLMSTNILAVLANITSKSVLTEKSKVAAPAPAAPMFFSCAACTYRNKGTAKQCEMCGTAAPSVAKPSEAKADDSQFQLSKLPSDVAKERIQFEATSWKVFKLLTIQLGYPSSLSLSSMTVTSSAESPAVATSTTAAAVVVSSSDTETKAAVVVAPVTTSPVIATTDGVVKPADVAPELTSIFEHMFGELSRSSERIIKPATTTATSTGAISDYDDPFSYPTGNNAFSSSTSASTNGSASSSSPADFALSFWVYLNHASQTKATILARSTLVDDNTGHHGARGIRMYSPAVTVHDPASGMLRVMVQTSANNEVLNSALAIPVREWTHVAVTLSTFTLKLYINSKLDTTKMLTGPPTPLRGKPLLQLGQIGMKVYSSSWYTIERDIMWINNGATASSFMDHFANQLVSLATLASNGNARSLLVQKKWMRLLYQLLLPSSSSSLSLRVRVLRLFRQVLPQLTPIAAHELVNERADEKSPGIIEYCFTAIADGLRSQQISSSSLYSEAVLLIRYLLAIDTVSDTQKAWQTSIVAFIKKSLITWNIMCTNVHRCKQADCSDLKVEDTQIGYALAAIYITASHTLSNTAFLSEHVSGSMSSVRGTLSSYHLYYHRLSDLFRTISALAVPDKTGAVPAAKKKEAERIPAGLQSHMGEMMMMGFSDNKIKSALVQSNGELTQAMNLIIEGRVDDHDPTAEWNAFLDQLAAAEKQRQEIKTGVIQSAKKKWTPLKEMEDMIGHIRGMIELYGTIDDKGVAPYSPVDFKLFRLGMITGVIPRSKAKPLEVKADVKAITATTASSATATTNPTTPSSTPSGTTAASDTITTASSSSASSSSTTSSTSSSVATSTTSSTVAANVIAAKVAAPKPKIESKGPKAYGGDEPKYWKSGTGYGHGEAKSNWDPEAQKLLLDKKNRSIVAILNELIEDVSGEEIPATLSSSLEQSCLIPMMEVYLRNDSFTDMERQGDLYPTLFSLCSAMMKHRDVAKLFLPLSNQRTSLLALTQELDKQAKLMDKFTEQGNDAREKKTLARRLLETCAIVTRTMKAIVMQMKLTEGFKEGKSENKEEDLYVQLLKAHRFREIKEFKMHHYWKDNKKDGITRAFMRRLQGEFADLYKSLPLFPDSSIFMRVQEGNMALAQILVLAPIDTPYARGSFLFDVHFPPEYPNGPPHVNLQTTGSGTVRFNPNLYNSGKVCLSLLNTWSGSKEEKWNPKTSTFLQVCVSLQSLIFIAEPYFNEPGYEKDIGTSKGREISNDYNSNIRIATMRFAMIDMIQNPPLGFEYVVLTHFFLQKENLLKQVESWLTDGVSTGGKLATLRSLVAELRALLTRLELPKPPVDEDE